MKGKLFKYSAGLVATEATCSIFITGFLKPTCYQKWAELFCINRHKFYCNCVAIWAMASYKGAVTSVSNLIQSMIDSPKVYAVIRLTIGLSSYGVEYLLL